MVALVGEGEVGIGYCGFSELIGSRGCIGSFFFIGSYLEGSWGWWLVVGRGSVIVIDEDIVFLVGSLVLVFLVRIRLGWGFVFI